MHSGGFELTKLSYTRLEDNLIRHRGDRLLLPLIFPLALLPAAAAAAAVSAAWALLPSSTFYRL